MVSQICMELSVDNVTIYTCRYFKEFLHGGWKCYIGKVKMHNATHKNTAR